jgi:hypothetical protein
MPYIAREERPAIDKVVDRVAERISGDLARGSNKETDISVYYRHAFVAIAEVLARLERAETVKQEAEEDEEGAHALAFEIFGEPSAPSRDRGSWLGRLNYALTRLIQVVPEKMVEKGAWREEFRYWVYAQTVGALARAAMEVDRMGDDCPIDGLVGVLVDVKDEYKRRVNAAYETFQIRRSGDCYNTRYRTELSEVKDSSGRVIGYADVMKDLGAGA